jgi:hypothetical protein
VAALRGAGPPFDAAYVASTGPQIGVRESRRPATVRRIRGDEIAAGSVPDDTVALGGWPMELHHAPGVQEYIPVGGDGVFGIPMASLRVADLANLLVAGRLIGADSRAFGSIRVMGTAFATGHAAGVHAALVASSSTTTVRVQDVRRCLAAQGAILGPGS